MNTTICDNNIKIIAKNINSNFIYIYYEIGQSENVFTGLTNESTTPILILTFG